MPHLCLIEASINRKVELISPASYSDVKDLLLSESTYDIVNLNGVLFCNILMRRDTKYSRGDFGEKLHITLFLLLIVIQH